MNRTCLRKRAAIVFAFALAISCALPVAGQTPAFNIVKPSTTGIPGEELRLMTFDPAGNLWVAGRWPFWGESGVAMLSADQLQANPLPGGGFDTGAWKVWSSVQNPIPSPYLYDMEFSADGTMWLASEGGLTRFRPNAPNPADRWFTYTPANSPLIVSSVLSIAIDSNGNIWVCNADVNQSRGLFKLNPQTNEWTHVIIQTAGGSPQLPSSVTLGNNNRVLVSMVSSGGFAEFDGSSWTMRSMAQPLDGLLQDAQGNVWAIPSVSGNGLWKWNGSSWQNWPTVGGTITITGLGKDRDGVVYVSTWYGGVYKMINDTPVFFVDADNIPQSVLGRPNGDIWISNYGGNGTLGTARQYTAAGQLLRRINTYNSGLPDYFIDHIKRDSSGNMWFASGEGGLSRMQGSNGASDAATHWRNWSNHNDNSEPYPWAGNEPMYSVHEDTNGIFWMGGNGVGRWDSNTGQFTGFWNWQNSNIDNSGIYALTKRGGTMWAGSGGSGVFWFDGVNWNHVTLSPGGYSYSPNNVMAMTVDTQDNLWVASEFGLRKFAPRNNSTFTQYDPSNTPLPSGGMLDVEADPTGGIWVATYAGLVRFDGTTWTTYNQANTGMPGTYVADVARRASDGLIAIASNQSDHWPYTGGVSTFDGTTWTHYTPDNSPLTHWQVVAVEFDGNGNLWASTISEGVVQIMIGTAPQALQFISAVSRKTHGSAGDFDVDLPVLGTPGVECRSSGGSHTLVFTLNNNVISGNAAVSSGIGIVVGSPVFSGNTMSINLTGVGNAQSLTVTLSGVTDQFSQVLPDTSVTAKMLIGDTNGNGVVNASDVSQTKSRSGQTATNANFRSDVVINGAINASDLALVKSRSGASAH